MAGRWGGGAKSVHFQSRNTHPGQHLLEYHLPNLFRKSTVAIWGVVILCDFTPQLYRTFSGMAPNNGAQDHGPEISAFFGGKSRHEITQDHCAQYGHVL